VRVSVKDVVGKCHVEGSTASYEEQYKLAVRYSYDIVTGQIAPVAQHFTADAIAHDSTSVTATSSNMPTAQGAAGGGSPDRNSSSSSSNGTDNSFGQGLLQQQQQQEPQQPPLHSMDIFAGCGGLSEGFHQSGVSECRWAVESNTAAAEAFQLNHPRARVFNTDCNAVLLVSEACGLCRALSKRV
jgi:hypothetical protein